MEIPYDRGRATSEFNLDDKKTPLMTSTVDRHRSRSTQLQHSDTFNLQLDREPRRFGHESSLEDPDPFTDHYLNVPSLQRQTSNLRRMSSLSLQIFNTGFQHLQFACHGAKFKCAWALLVQLLGMVFLVALFFLIVGVVLHQNTIPYAVHKFDVNPPWVYRNGRLVASTPSLLYMTFVTDENQVWMELSASMPFKSGSSTVLDFDTHSVIITDHALRKNGRNFLCFVLPLKRAAIHSKEVLRKAVDNTREINSTHSGWDEHWHYMPEVIPTSQIPVKYSNEIDVCKGEHVRWIRLNQVARNLKGMECFECHNFCLPEYGLERNHFNPLIHLTIRRLICFYLNVPEWRQFLTVGDEEDNRDQRFGVWGDPDQIQILSE